jgi:hypothetical protein
MNKIKKRRMKVVFKYTWPIYLVTSLVIGLGLFFTFKVTHKTPLYKTLTLFVSGEVKDNKSLRNDLLETYKSYDLKTVSCISSYPSDANYNSKLTIPGYNSADILIIPESKLNDVVVSAFGLEITDEIKDSYYSNNSFYIQEEKRFGIKLDNEKVNNYFSLPSEELYIVINAKSVNIGEYSSKPNKEHDMALQLAKNWGK